jgi:hypothetical protein
LRLHNGWWAWLSDSYPAGRFPDTSISNKELAAIKRNIDSRERILVDLGWFKSVENSPKIFLFGHKKQPKQELEDWQVHENEVFGHFRGNYLIHIVDNFC